MRSRGWAGGFDCAIKEKAIVMLHHFPDWSGWHVMIVHIPIILLLVAPFIIILGIGLPAAKRGLFLGAALTLMVLGTTLTFAAVATGERAAKFAGGTPASRVALEGHRALAEASTELFSLLTLGFMALLIAPRLLGRGLESRINTALLAIYLIFYTTGALFLVHTALHGVHLVHEFEAKSTAIHHLTGTERAR
jgi:hypothetical protein